MSEEAPQAALPNSIVDAIDFGTFRLTQTFRVDVDTRVRSTRVFSATAQHLVSCSHGAQPRL